MTDKKVKFSFVVVFATILILGMGAFTLQQNKSSGSKAIHIKSNGGEKDWSLNPEDPDALEETAGLIVKVKYTGKRESFMPKNDFVPDTAYTVDVLEVLKGDVETKQIEIVREGGKIPLKEYIKNVDSDVLEEDPDLLEMSEKTIAKSTFEDTDDFGVQLSKNDTMIVYLNLPPDEDGRYYILCCGLGLFEENKDGEYVNPQNELVVDEEIIEEIEEERRKK